MGNPREVPLHLAYTSLIGDLLYRDTTPMGHRARATKHAGPVELLLPAPTKAHVTFNLNMMFLWELDRDEVGTTLPREFYNIPAHKHVERWIPRAALGAPRDPAFEQELLKLYSHVGHLWGRPSHDDARGWYILRVCSCAARWSLVAAKRPWLVPSLRCSDVPCLDILLPLHGVLALSEDHRGEPGPRV